MTTSPDDLRTMAHDDITGDDTEIIYRSAPRWAWEIIDETLALDAKSGAFDFDLRQRIADATTAMILSCDRADDAAISREDAADFRDLDDGQWTPGQIAKMVMFGKGPE